MEQYDLVVDLHDSLRTVYLGILQHEGSCHRQQACVCALAAGPSQTQNGGIVPVADRYIESLREFGIENDGKGWNFYSR